MTEALTVQEEKDVGGRPLSFATPEELKNKVDNFFIHCDAVGDIPTVLGLAIFLDVDRKTILNYSNREAYFPILKRGMDIITHVIEQRGLKDKGNAAFLMYWLGNNTKDWKNERYEHTSVHHSGNVNVTLLPGGGYDKKAKKEVIDV